MEVRKNANDFKDYRLEILKKAMRSTKDPELLNTVEEQWVDTRGICDFFGVSESTVQRMREQGQIPYTYFGSKCIYPKRYVFISLLVKALENMK